MTEIYASSCCKFHNAQRLPEDTCVAKITSPLGFGGACLPASCLRIMAHILTLKKTDRPHSLNLWNCFGQESHACGRPNVTSMEFGNPCSDLGDFWICCSPRSELSMDVYIMGMCGVLRCFLCVGKNVCFLSGSD